MNLDFLYKNDLIIFDAISGSHAYGTNTPNSDIDKRGVFILPQEFIDPDETLNGFVSKNYVEQVSDEKNDIIYYEIRRFLELVNNNNPNILELLNVPEDCIIKKHPVFDNVLKEKDKLITKLCKYTFSGFIRQQITKATGLNKKQKWESEKVTRKYPIDFCYIVSGMQSKPLREVLERDGLDMKFCGLAKVPHTRDCYALFYDWEAHKCFSELVDVETREKYRNNKLKTSQPLGLGYKGLEVEKSNTLRLSGIPCGISPIYNIVYNESSYSVHCREYKEYQDWLENRNENRYTDFASHGQGLDGKNMLHSMRLLEMSKEIATGQGINVRRPNGAELLKIRKGEVSLQEIVERVKSELPLLDELYDKSDLPERPNFLTLNEILRTVRSEFYAEVKQPA